VVRLIDPNDRLLVPGLTGEAVWGTNRLLVSDHEAKAMLVGERRKTVSNIGRTRLQITRRAGTMSRPNLRPAQRSLAPGQSVGPADRVRHS
jgi:hypothetical protein